MTIKLKTLSASVKIPVMDLYADEQAWLYPNQPLMVKTGLCIELPPGYEAQIRTRSSMSLTHGVSVLNSPGTIDPSYRGEIGVILNWNGYRQVGGQPFVIEKGMRIAQMVVAQYEKVEFDTTGDLSSSERGEGGFGSTGA